jgi:hypothetical protein
VLATGKVLFDLFDEIVVPLPPIAEQAKLVASHTRLESALAIVRSSIHDLWSAKQPPSQITRRVDGLFDESLSAWIDELPYPIASALRTLEADRYNTHAAHRQMFRVWESYAAFWGIVLLSAVDSDPATSEEQRSGARKTLSEQNLSFERASIGSWNVIIQTLSKHFRSELAAEPARRNKVLQSFGSPLATTLARLLDSSVVDLITKANHHRNTLDGHSAANSESILRSELSLMNDLLQNLKASIGSSWLELQLLRAGSGDLIEGEIVQEAEILTGAATPFMRTKLRVGGLMERDALYVATDGAPEPLRILPLVQLRAAPAAVHDTCYFFNRLEKSQRVRMVSYQLTSDGEVTEPNEAVRSALNSLLEG